MHIDSKLKAIWKTDTPPPEEPKKYDELVTFTLDEIVLHGLVSWDTARRMYSFQLVSKVSKTDFKKRVVIVSSDNYLFIRTAVRDSFGVFVTKGIYDEQCPPMTGDALPKVFAVLSNPY